MHDQRTDFSNFSKEICSTRCMLICDFVLFITYILSARIWNALHRYFLRIPVHTRLECIKITVYFFINTIKIFDWTFRWKFRTFDFICSIHSYQLSPVKFRLTFELSQYRHCQLVSSVHWIYFCSNWNINAAIRFKSEEIYLHHSIGYCEDATDKATKLKRAVACPNIRTCVTRFLQHKCFEIVQNEQMKHVPNVSIKKAHVRTRNDLNDVMLSLLCVHYVSIC